MSKKQKSMKPKIIVPSLNKRVLFAPLVVFLGFIPLIVRLNVINLSGDINVAWTSSQAFDFFSWYKSNIIIFMVLFMVAIFVYYLSQGDKLTLDKTEIMAYGSNVLFLAFGLLSTVLSAHTAVAWWGAPERCEGMVMLICYCVMMMYAAYAFRQISDFRYIVIPLCFLTAVNAFLGIFQFFGHDLFATELGKMIIIPSALASLRDNLELLFAENKIYGTMFHYNYMGSFGAMMAPLFLTLAVFLKGKRPKILFGGMSLLALFLLFGSTSRAGIIGFSMAILCFVIVFARKIMAHYKITLSVIIAFIVFAFGLNVVTSGAIFSRVPTLVNDVVAFLGGSDRNFDYRKNLPINDIRFNGKEITFIMHDEALTIIPDNDSVSFADKAGQSVNYILVGDTYQTQDARFSSFTFGETSVIGLNAAVPVLTMREAEQIRFLIAMDQTETYLVDSRFNKINYVDAPSIGFNGQEKLGSARGYIWSRCLPVALECLFIGKGPDTFILNFPQGDLLGKWYAYGTPWMTVDKPHNLYLQIWISQGAIALVAFLALTLGYLVVSFKRYAFRTDYTSAEIIGAALTVAVAGYLGAGIFNDSIVSVAPIFWVLLGVGIAVNRVVGKQQIKQNTEH